MGVGLCSGVGADEALLAGPVVPADDEAGFPPSEQAASNPTIIIASKHPFTERKVRAILKVWHTEKSRYRMLLLD
jgi:hypothetical protein